jgi:hypothetical protein
MIVLPWLVFMGQKNTLNFKIRVVSAFLAVFVITAAVGKVAEVRTFLPCIALLIACAVAIPKSSEIGSRAQNGVQNLAMSMRESGSDKWRPPH